MTKYTASTRSIKIALLVSLALVILQAISYLLTNMQSQLASALDSSSDVLISTFLLLSVIRSRKPPDEFHMFGHGRAQNVAALISATVLIFILSFGAFQAAVPKLFQAAPNEFHNTNLAAGVTVIAILAYGIPLVDMFRSNSKSAAAKAQIVALLEMEIAFVAVLVGVILVDQGFQLADPIVSIFVASVIAISGIYLLKDNANYLIGKSPGKEFMEKVESTAKLVKGVLGVHDLKAEFVGPDIIQASFHIQVAKGTPIENADRIAHEVEEEVSKKVNCQYCTIHIDPSS